MELRISEMRIRDRGVAEGTSFNDAHGSGYDSGGGGTARGYQLLPAGLPWTKALHAGDKATMLADQLRQLTELDVQLVKAGSYALRLGRRVEHVFAKQRQRGGGLRSSTQARLVLQLRPQLAQARAQTAALLAQRAHIAGHSAVSRRQQLEFAQQLLVAAHAHAQRRHLSGVHLLSRPASGRLTTPAHSASELLLG